jgi:t-SNARE complex subunit (syntaxin)
MIAEFSWYTNYERKEGMTMKMTQQINKMEKDIQSLHSDVRDLNTHAKYTKQAVDDIKKTLVAMRGDFVVQQDKCSAKFVKRVEFETVKIIAYGLITAIVTGFVFLIRIVFFNGVG